MKIFVPLLLLAWMALACRSQPFGELERADAGMHLDLAEADIQAGEFQRALDRLAAVHAIGRLDPDLRVREESLIESAARGRFDELADAPPDELEELFESELPERVRARAGVLAAERLLADGFRISAFRMIKEVDETLPRHPERVFAGDVLARAGLSLIRDDGRYNLLFHYRPRGIQALEYLVVHHPLEPRAPEAYFELSQVYERQGDLDQAIERTGDLLLYHPESVYAPAASARLPYLRLCRLRRDDYDRGELLRARSEIEAWKALHPGHELESWVAELERECQTRLVRSDLILAGFHASTEAPAGVRLHAERARDLARAAGVPGAEDAEARLADAESLPVESPPAPATNPSEPTDFPAPTGPPDPTGADPIRIERP